MHRLPRAPVAALDLARAAGHQLREPRAGRDAREGLERLAVDQRRGARAAVVHEQQVARAQERPVGAVYSDLLPIEGSPARPRRRRSAEPRVVAARGQPAEADPDVRPARLRRVERPRDRAAPAAQPAAAVVEHHKAPGRRLLPAASSAAPIVPPPQAPNSLSKWGRACLKSLSSPRAARGSDTISGTLVSSPGQVHLFGPDVPSKQSQEEPRMFSTAQRQWQPSQG